MRDNNKCELGWIACVREMQLASYRIRKTSSKMDLYLDTYSFFPSAPSRYNIQSADSCTYIGRFEQEHNACRIQAYLK